MACAYRATGTGRSTTSPPSCTSARSSSSPSPTARSSAGSGTPTSLSCSIREGGTGMETPLTPLEFARRTRKLYGDREGVVDGDLRLTYEEFFDRCDRWSSALQSMGVVQGDRVAYIAPNTHEQLESFYAVPQIGAVLVPINYRLTAEDFLYITSHSGAKVLCVHPDYLDAIDGVRDQLNAVEHFVSLGSAGGRKGWTEYEAAFAASKPDFARPEIAEGDLLTITYTGGTPAAATIERMEGDLGWEVTQVYGLTETAPFITICEPRPEHKNLGTTELGIVKARTGVELITSGELRVVDEAGKDVPADGQTLGEIVARGNVIMKGYYNDPDATKKVMGDGWFHTGDAAVLHPDGYVEIRDRIKDVIISGGENISSLEVEGVLLRHPAVQEVAIVGLPHEKWGEAPYAYVVLTPGASATEAELIAFTRDRLAHFKAPHVVPFVAALPKAATGRIEKFVLRKGATAVVRQ